jgi:putative hydrolase of the HAD superfamily
MAGRYTARVKASLDGRPLAALLLDLDDTILDDGAGFHEAWALAADMLVARHPALPRAAVVAEIDRARTWFWADEERHRRGRLDLPAARAEILAGALEALGRPDPALAREAGLAYTALRERSQRFLPGAREALEALRRAVPALALVTNGAAAAQRRKLARFGLEGFFDHVQIEGEFGAGKPEPAVYEHVLARLAVRPDECLMVGNDFEADVLGAQHAGLHAAWVDAGGRSAPPRTAPRPHWTVPDLEALLRLLVRIRAWGAGGRAR